MIKTAKIMMTVIIVLAFFLAAIMSDLAVATSVPDTGKTKCYSTWWEISCPKPGEPFYGQDAQYITNPRSFTKLDENGNDLPFEAPAWVMVRDNVTGLIWEVKNDDGDIHDVDNHYDWNRAWNFFILNLNSENFGGYNDWRLPTVKELSYLIDTNRSYPSIDSTYFPNSVNNRPDSEKTWQWHTSTEGAGDPNLNWRIKFDLGWIRGSFSKSEFKLVRAVRGGPSESVDNFIDNGDGTVTDTNTGLMWEQNGSTFQNWEGALEYCEVLTLADHHDWRLPNINELTSLVDYSTSNPAIKAPLFPNTESSAYWSSTTRAEFLGIAWYISFDNGYMRFGDKLNDFFYVRAVRGGEAQVDSDSDGITDNSDICPYHYNPEQEDADLNGIGNVCQCNLDANKDGKVNNIDFGYLKREIGRIDCCVQIPCLADGNCDNRITNTDFSIFKKEYGKRDCYVLP